MATPESFTPSTRAMSGSRPRRASTPPASHRPSPPNGCAPATSSSAAPWPSTGAKVRVGKGAGYSDLEVALLTEAGLIGPHTTIVTTVHQLQVVDDKIPDTSHDFSVDIIVTPDEVIFCAPRPRPTGIALEHLNPDKIKSIPALAARRESQP
ncbi:5-formyltetrahydrofolate cyclo-ligase [Amycolatopsis sp. CA-161197]|uniref:5-formyltetrahydrofolate cyclo-ligase n=1 Tax=Amycolatopsis sp. CA-161197 TaxID=3239922 RepID=UPI003D91B95E